MANFLENLLSFKKEKIVKQDGLIKVYRVITILGIKLKFCLYEYYNPQSQDTIPLWLEKFIHQSWEHLEFSKQGEYFERDMENLEFILGQKAPKDTQLIFISLFLEDKAYSKAAFSLNQYLKKYGEDGLWEWLLISNYMVENNLTQNPKILKANKLYKIFEKAEKEDTFANYLKGKTIAVVGNGPCEIEEANDYLIELREEYFKENDVRFET